MSLSLSETEQYIPMSWDDYLELDDTVRGEYLGGFFVVSSRPNMRHERIINRLSVAIDATIPPGVERFNNLGWSPAGVHEEVGPDILVVPPNDDFLSFTGTPLLVVEVMSTNRRRDLVDKLERYQAWGLRDYWIVDPRDSALLIFRRQGDELVETGRLTEGRTTLTYAEVEVPVDLDVLLA